MRDIYRPLARVMSQVECDQVNALREYEKAHKIWMNTSVFGEAGKVAWDNLAACREKLIEATKAAHPTWIVM